MRKHFRVTHPFHPLFGREFELIEYHKTWGEDRVFFRDPEGQLQSIVASCTDVGGVDPFVEIAAGRSFFRYEDLVRLADLLEGFSAEGRIQPCKDNNAAAVKRTAPQSRSDSQR